MSFSGFLFGCVVEDGSVVVNINVICYFCGLGLIFLSLWMSFSRILFRFMVECG